MTGKIRSKIADKGYGFIRSDENDKEYFFHLSQCITEFEQLSVGDQVEFDVEQSPKGMRAVDVEKV